MTRLYICGLITTTITIPLAYMIGENNHIKKTRPYMTKKDKTIFLAEKGFSTIPFGIAFGVIWPISLPILVLSGVLSQDNNK